MGLSKVSLLNLMTLGEDRQEADFIIVNNTRQYVMNLEVKKWLGSIEGKPQKCVKKKTKDQLEKIKQIIQEWFGPHLQGQWKYISAVYCDKMEENIDVCKDCRNLIAEGTEELRKMLDFVKKVTD